MMKSGYQLQWDVYEPKKEGLLGLEDCRRVGLKKLVCRREGSSQQNTKGKRDENYPVISFMPNDSLN